MTSKPSRFINDGFIRNPKELLERYFPLDEVPRLDERLLRHPRYEGKFPGARNEKGYRGDSFEVRGDFNIAYFGDSWVEGHGTARGEIFPDRVSETLGKTTGLAVKSWNFGLSGTGLDYMLRLAPVVCRTLRPDFVVVVLTQVNRREYFSGDGKRMMLRMRQFINAQKNRASYDDYDFAIFEQFAALDNQYENLAYTIRHFRALEAVFQAWSIPWAFSWVDLDDTTEPLGFLLDEGALPRKNYLGEIFERFDRAEASPVHPGAESHQVFAEAILAWIREHDLTRRSPLMREGGTNRVRGAPSVAVRIAKAWRSMLPQAKPKPPAQGQKIEDRDDGDHDMYPLW